MKKVLNHKEKVYDNCGVYAPDGVLLSYVSHRKANWYLKNELGVKIADDPLCVKLLFEPKSRSNENDPIVHKKNRCVECGGSKKLTRHHIVPYCFRVLMPKSYTNHNSYDLAVMCRDCHDKYELEANKLKNVLIEQFIPVYKIGMDKDFIKGRNILRKLERDKDVISDIQKEALLKKVGDIKEKWCVEDDILLKHEQVNIFKEILKVLGTEVLIHLWQGHFFDTVKPKFIGDYWTPYFIRTNEI